MAARAGGAGTLRAWEGARPVGGFVRPRAGRAGPI